MIGMYKSNILYLSFSPNICVLFLKNSIFVVKVCEFSVIKS